MDFLKDRTFWQQGGGDGDKFINKVRCNRLIVTDGLRYGIFK